MATKRNLYILSWFFLCISFLPLVVSQCSSFISDNDKRDCYPWPDASLTTCQSRGCLWCESETPGVPWCFANDEACPSDIPEPGRVDCHPEPGVNRDSCTSRGCQYCPTQSAGVPWCFTDSTLDPGGNRCPATPEEDRVDCFPEGDVTMEKCIAKGCYYCESATQGVPFCFTSPTMGYSVQGDVQSTPKGFYVDLSRVNTPSWFGEDIVNLRVDVEFQEDERVRVKIYDPSNTRWEVPLEIPSPDTAAANPLYDVIITSDPVFSFQVVRISTGETLFDSSLGALQFADQYLQFAARFPTDKIYGFGETEHHSLKHDMNWRHWGMWSRDEPTTDGNIYGVHPYMMGMDSQNDMFGMLILNSNAQEIVMTPAPGLVYRTIGGVLDFYFFLGPSPENVVQQYTQAIGRPVMPPYWMLGFQLSRYGYNSLATMSETIDRMRQYDIPHDVQHGDIDYLEAEKIFTYDTVAYAGMPEFIRELKQQGTRFITILDPFVAFNEPPGTYGTYERGQQMDVWVKESDGVTNAEAVCWPGDAVYPDYSSQSGKDWWVQECQILHETIEFDGLWVDMNEPAAFVEGSLTGCNNNKINLPLFKPPSIYGPRLADKTLCPDFLSTFGNQYNTHSIYGWSTSPPSLNATRISTGTRSYVVTRSTYPGSGKYVGHWLGDNAAEWDHMKYSVIGILEFNFFGIPYVGADICGFFQDSYPSLCKRWMQLGSFYTFSRNHNGIGWAEHDPGFWPDVAVVSRETLHIRYTLLPYLYTLFYKSHVFGNTVLRPLYHEFVNDPLTHDIDEQFLWGEAFLITPVLYQDDTTVTAYFPDARWYSYYDGRLEPTRGGYTTLSAPVDFIPLHFRGGYVIPTQEPANSTMFSRSKPMGLIVTLDDAEAATGSLFWDDEDVIDTYENGEYFLAEYSVAASLLTASVVSDGYLEMAPLIFNSVRVYGQEIAVTSVTVNGADWPDFTYDADAQVLDISALSLAVRSDFTISWS